MRDYEKDFFVLLIPSYQAYLGLSDRKLPQPDKVLRRIYTATAYKGDLRSFPCPLGYFGGVGLFFSTTAKTRSP